MREKDASDCMVCAKSSVRPHSRPKINQGMKGEAPILPFCTENTKLTDTIAMMLVKKWSCTYTGGATGVFDTQVQKRSMPVCT